MKHSENTLASEYCGAMRDFVARGEEAALRRAYEIGRRALAEGAGVLEMAAAHQKSLIGALRDCPGEQEKEQALLRALACFAESLSPFEVAWRGIRESNARLQQSLSNAERAEERLRSQRDSLTFAHKAIEQQRRGYQALFDFSPDGYLVTGNQGTVWEANRAAAALLNTPRELLRGHSLVEFVVEAERERFRERLRELHAGMLEKVEDWHVTIQPRNRPPVAVAATVVPESSAPAVDTLLRWQLRDTGVRERLEPGRGRSLGSQDNAEASRRFEFLAEASSLLGGSLEVHASLVRVARLAVSYLAAWCFVNVVERDGSFRQLAVAHERPSGAPLAATLKGFCLFGARTPMGRNQGLFAGVGYIVDKVTDNWYEEIAESSAHARVLRQLRGRSAMVVPLRIHDRILGALTFLSAPSGRRYRPMDLTLCEDLGHRCALALENARLYREVVEERDRAEKASRAKDEFMAILSHELRNPLMPVIGWARMMKTHTVIVQNPVLAEGARSIERNAQTLARLVEDCLDQARISQGKIQMERTTLDLNRIIRISLEAVQQMAMAKELKITTDLLPEPLPVLGDATRLEEVVMNLLVNAVKYTNNHGVISVRSLRLGGEAEIEVKDTGIGILPGFLEQIFQPFSQGTNTWLTSQSGLGLGLAIARQIVVMHGGRIWAESEGLDYGSTFHVRLPVVSGTPMQTSLDSQTPRQAEQTGSARILLVEDSKDVLFLIKVELEQLGHSVLTAEDGIRGLELAKTGRPDLIISDIKMPGMDGYELIREIRAIPELCVTPAIALTGLGAKADIDRAMAAGFDACISKPAEPGEISALINKLTRKQDGPES